MFRGEACTILRLFGRSFANDSETSASSIVRLDMLLESSEYGKFMLLSSTEFRILPNLLLKLLVISATLIRQSMIGDGACLPELASLILLISFQNKRLFQLERAELIMIFLLTV